MHFKFSSLPQRLLMSLVRGYRLLLSPWLGSSCRFEPTCSVYSLQALEQHGALAGTYLSMHRVMRCHPFCAGGHDAVPEQAPEFFRRTIPARVDSIHVDSSQIVSRHIVTGFPAAGGIHSSVSKSEPIP